MDRKTQLFVVLAGLFITCLLVGDITGGKLFDVPLFGWRTVTLSVGMLPFPVTFLLTDLLNEFYGKKAARFVTWTGFGMALLAFALIEVAIAVPWAPFTRAADWAGVNAGAFDNVFAGSKRILFASMIAYLVAQFTDIGVFNVLKRLTQNRLLWLRATGSTVVSQLIDTVLVQVIAWYGLLTAGQIADIALGSYIMKLLVAVALTPVVYAGHALLQRQLRIDPIRLDDRGEPVATEASSTEPRPAL